MLPALPVSLGYATLNPDRRHQLVTHLRETAHPYRVKTDHAGISILEANDSRWLVRVYTDAISLNYEADLEHVGQAVMALHRALGKFVEHWPAALLTLKAKATTLGWEVEPLYAQAAKGPVAGLLITPTEHGRAVRSDAGAIDDASRPTSAPLYRYTGKWGTPFELVNRALNRHDYQKLLATTP